MSLRTTSRTAPAAPRASAFPDSSPDTAPDTALERRGSPLLAAAGGPCGSESPHDTPGPTPAHPTVRAVRVRRSPR